jgi:putative addiction module component (TIGR02574 family)
MDLFTDTIRGLEPAEKLQLVERIWDDLAALDSPLPLPDWALTEASRRRDEMLADPNLGSTHDVVWKRISDSRDGDGGSGRHVHLANS